MCPPIRYDITLSVLIGPHSHLMLHFGHNFVVVLPGLLLLTYYLPCSFDSTLIKVTVLALDRNQT